MNKLKHVLQFLLIVGLTAAFYFLFWVIFFGGLLFGLDAIYSLIFSAAITMGIITIMAIGTYVFRKKKAKIVSHRGEK